MGFVLTDRLIAVHENPDCNVGWCSSSDGTPVPYPHTCGGTVHGDFDRQDSNGWFVMTGCDQCSFRELVYHTPDEKFVDHADVTVVQTLDAGAPVKKAPAKKAAKKTGKRATPRSK